MVIWNIRKNGLTNFDEPLATFILVKKRCPLDDLYQFDDKSVLTSARSVLLMSAIFHLLWPMD